MAPALLLRCGCELPFREGQAPICPVHGLQAITRVLRMPPPRFRGTAKGPHVKTEDLAPSMARFAGSEAKES